MIDNVRIRFSLGLIFIAIVHALLLGVVLEAVQSFPRTANQRTVPSRDFTVGPLRTPPSTPAVGQIEKLPEPSQVNLQAQGEVKQQDSGYCPPCPPTRIVVRPAVRRPTVVPLLITPEANPTPESRAPAAPTISDPTPPPPKNSFQLALFVTSDAQSLRLQQWFAEDSQLRALREKCEFQVYTSNNAIYRTRFAEIVPAEQFPVVLFQDSTGGHIHAAGRSMIPSTASELHSDLRQGYELYQQAKQAQKTGAMKTRGYSWDDAISPTLYLATDDCPDGYCPVEPEDTWRPGDRVRDGLFDRDSSDDRSALMWLSAGEIATVALIIVAVMLLGFILLKRGL